MQKEFQQNKKELKLRFFVSVLDAAIRVSGTTFSIFNQTSSGGSSGGTIILSSRKVKHTCP